MPLRLWRARERPLPQRIRRLPCTPTFSVVTGDPDAARALVYPAFEVVPDYARAGGEFVVFASAGDALAPSALVAAAERIAARPDTDLVYSDEVGADGTPFHKPDWSPELLLAQPYVLRFAALRRTAIEAAGGPATAPGWDGAAREYDLALRLCAVARRVEHVPELLCRRGRPHPPTEADLEVAAAAAERRGLRARVARCAVAAVHSISLVPVGTPAVTVIVPTRDRLDLLRRCIDSLLQRTTYPHFAVRIVDNGSELHETLDQLRAWQRDPRVSVVRDPSPFHWAELMNRAAAGVATPLLAFLNNDTEVITPRWLDEMVGWIEQPDVGAVGARLWYDDGRLQHAGVVLGIGGVATHGHKGLPRGEPGYHGLPHCVRDVSAVTGACMLTRADLFARLGGFEPTLRVAYNDVDYCLRLRERGQRVLFTPAAELHHREGGSRGDDTRGQRRFDREIRWMQKRWGRALLEDPFYNPNLSLDHTDYRSR